MRGKCEQHRSPASCTLSETHRYTCACPHARLLHHSLTQQLIQELEAGPAGPTAPCLVAGAQRRQHRARSLPHASCRPSESPPSYSNGDEQLQKVDEENVPEPDKGASSMPADVTKHGSSSQGHMVCTEFCTTCHMCVLASTAGLHTSKRLQNRYRLPALSVLHLRRPRACHGRAREQQLRAAAPELCRARWRGPGSAACSRRCSFVPSGIGPLPCRRAGPRPRGLYRVSTTCAGPAGRTSDAGQILHVTSSTSAHCGAHKPKVSKRVSITGTQRLAFSGGCHLLRTWAGCGNLRAPDPGPSERAVPRAGYACTLSARHARSSVAWPPAACSSASPAAARGRCSSSQDRRGTA